MTPPRLQLTLSPQPDGMRVDYVVESPDVPAAGTLFRLPRIIVGIPGSAVSTAEIEATDADGRLELVETDEPATSSGTYRRWSATRDTAGDLHVRYFAPVRVVERATRNGPLFDLRAEAGGLNGAGVTFLALPDTTVEYDVTLTWDVGGGSGVSGLGEGMVRTTATAERLAFCFYMAGPVRRHPDTIDSTFVTYWSSDPSFDTMDVAARCERIYRTMSKFFREPTPGHRVFIRKHPYPGNGGTALPRSFMFGYSELESPDVDDLATLIAHETAHNWPRLDGEHGRTAWYTEGTAEYYSIILAYRAGLVDESAFLRLVNDRARGYYTNPLQRLSNDQVAERFWRDQRAQRVPYGRGLFYFVDLNAKIRARTEERRSLDDLVLEVLDRQRSGEEVGVPEWIDLVRGELGDAGQADFEAMSAGRPIVPRSDAFGSGFIRETEMGKAIELGFAISSLETGVVTDLIPGSGAERAGVREGDRILVAPGGAEVARGRISEVSLTLERGSRSVHLTYAPEGEEVELHRWCAVRTAVSDG
ncbi:hypothetical protein [Amycolatopsis saalfeldensis]|uniref:Predicted metalloprotease, contains C-terminal PDZ domain n=1 Tax=Amycolatopsis saalfeldensis TaxID=394193 RepID=A0A1H8XXV5_9PSEU|nr:hypothetical protein [Amycolatopsis saalfeldensis]SEP44593.1 Predicted metalloprotease, contains C-terminal PDZ domain [Amycolatopsis saalfeldensis]